MKNASTTLKMQQKALNAYINAHLKLFQSCIDESLKKSPMLRRTTIMRLSIERLCKEKGYYCGPYFPHEVRNALEKKGYNVNVREDVDKYVWVTISW